MRSILSSYGIECHQAADAAVFEANMMGAFRLGGGPLVSGTPTAAAERPGTGLYLKEAPGQSIGQRGLSRRPEECRRVEVGPGSDRSSRAEVDSRDDPARSGETGNRSGRLQAIHGCR